MARDEELKQEWRSRIQTDCPTQPVAAQESIIQWLFGEDAKARFSQMSPDDLAIAQQAMDYRFRILKQRYLDAGPDAAYRKLLQRLSSLFLIRNKIRTWVALSRDRRRTVMDVLQEVLQELIQSDRYIRQQMSWISQCSTSPRLRNALVLTTLEEYCLRPIRNQPLLVYRFVNYLRRTQRGGMTQVPTGELIRLVSEEIAPDDPDNPLSLLDNQAIAQYQEEEAWAEQQSMRTAVKQEFSSYLAAEVDPLAARWLELHLQGHSQEAIARTLDRPIKEIYRLREKISYHAIRVFTVKTHPDLVTSWLGTALENDLGLTPSQWGKFQEELSPEQQKILQSLKSGSSIDDLSGNLNLRANQIAGEWIKIYLSAQKFRSNAP
jgi:hypothetical protein